MPRGWQLPLFLVTGIAAGMTVPFCILLGPYAAYLLIITVPLFLWKTRRWNQPRWVALSAALAGSGMAAVLSQRGLAEAGVTALIAFTVGGQAAFSFADTVNELGESRALPHVEDIPKEAQERGYRHRALRVHTLHYAVRKRAGSIIFADMDRPPRTSAEWTSALTIARALNKPTARQLRNSWNALVNTGRPLDTIAAITAQADEQTAMQFLTSAIPDEYLTEVIR